MDRQMTTTTRPKLRRFDLAEALAFRRGSCVITMSENQWDTTLRAAYDSNWILLELDANENPIAAYRAAD
jgi:hypothetical protein